MKIHKYLLSFITILVLISAVIYIFSPKNNQVDDTPNFENSETEVTTFSIEQTIKFSAENQESEQIEVVDGDNALDALLKNKDAVVKEYSFGQLVESIDGITNGTNDKYWIFYINNNESQVGAEEYILQPNDKIEWSFEAYEQ